MTKRYNTFLKKSEQISFDPKHRSTIKFNISKYDAAVKNGKERYSDLELARERAASIKSKTLANLDTFLTEFETNITARGAKVLWAQDAQEAVDLILPILKKHQAKHLVKSKSMITEEIELNHHLEIHGVESLETDLGEYIVQLAGEKPYHIVTPVMHKSRKDIAALFHEKFNTPEESTPEYLTHFVRNLLRQKFVNADIGVTGGNFLVADVGGVCVTENEGNGLLSTSFPKVHIAIVGIEKVIPRMQDLALMWPLLATHGTGQQVTVYNSLIMGPRQEGESDGPDEMYVVLLDNGRTHLMEQDEQYEALKCIRCGACLNACPIYRNIGGYTYESTYGGPIGSVITPHFKDLKEYNHLSFACTVCGKCTEVCPVKIPLHYLMLANRRDAVEIGYTYLSWDIGMKCYEQLMLHRRFLDIVGGDVKNIAAGMLGRKVWGPRRKLPLFAKQSFSKQWRKKRPRKGINRN